MNSRNADHPPKKFLGFDSIIVRYSGEIGVKGAWTRRNFERRLWHNMERVLNHHKVPYDDAIRKYGRLYLKTQETEEALKKLFKVFGISSLSPALESKSKIDDIISKSLFLASSTLQMGESFAVRCRRVGEQPYTSSEICREVGSKILSELAELDLRVNLERPNVELGIEIREDRAFIYNIVVKGVGGMPLGTQPKVVCLLSGGIDSPVACWLAMKRGCPIVPIYLDNAPFTDGNTTKRALNTAEALFDWALGFQRSLYVIQHGQNLKEIKENCPERFTCILCKRLMYRVAERIADLEGAEGIITGEAIGEQASQTMRNLRVLSAAAVNYPIHRPLLGFDKVEIVEIARKIGTYDVSIQKVKSCTAVPRKPATSANPKKVAEAEKALMLDEMVERSINSLKILYF